MKKTFLFLSSLLVVAFLTVSCETDTIDDTIQSANRTTNVDPDLNENAGNPSFSVFATTKQELTNQGIDLFWDLNNPDGYLHTNDVNSGALWGWTDNSASYGNISAPISYYLYKSDLEDPSVAGFDAMHARTSADVTNPDNFSTADMGVFLFAYQATGDPKYLQIANDMAATWISKYASNGFPFRGVDTYWGYDSVNWMRSAYYILQTNGVDQSLIDWANESITAYETDQVNYTNDPYHATYMNVNSTVYQAGIFTTINAADIEALDSGQIYAYSKIGGTTGDEYDQVMAEKLYDDLGGVSEVAAELIYSLIR